MDRPRPSRHARTHHGAVPLPTPQGWRRAHRAKTKTGGDAGRRGRVWSAGVALAILILQPLYSVRIRGTHRRGRPPFIRIMPPKLTRLLRPPVRTRPRPVSSIVPTYRHPRVFVSYARDSKQHTEEVRRFCVLLRKMGIDVRLDQWDEDRRRDWSSWATQQVHEADFVLVLASPGYKLRAEDSTESTGGGVQFEAALLREQLFGNRNTWLPKILPVLLPGCHVDDIPLFLQPRTASHYKIVEITAAGVEELLRVLTAQPAHHKSRLGKIRRLPSHTR